VSWLSYFIAKEVLFILLKKGVLSVQQLKKIKFIISIELNIKKFKQILFVEINQNQKELDADENERSLTNYGNFFPQNG